MAADRGKVFQEGAVQFAEEKDQELKSVELKFSKTSSHLVAVRVYKTTGSMRSFLSKLGHKDPKHTNACCWQANNPGTDSVVAEMHFAADNLHLKTIAHECLHAAWHRVCLMGLPMDDAEFQEYVACATGLLTDTLIGWLDREGFHIKLNCVPQRRVITMGRK